MADEVVTGFWKAANLRAVCATTTELSTRARELHQASGTSAVLLSQALTASALLSALQLGKGGGGRINLQVECDGPLRGLFADADADGNLRGYAKNPLIDVEGAQGPFRWRPALGNKGFLSVLREMKEGEFFRSSVELTHFDLSRDLAYYFEQSDQIDTLVRLESTLDHAAGLVVQKLPGADAASFARVRERLAAAPVEEALRGGSASQLLGAVFTEEYELTGRTELRYRCRCSRERVLTALRSMGRAELEDILQKEGKAEVTCEFCAAHYEISREEIRQLLSAPSA